MQRHRVGSLGASAALLCLLSFSAVFASCVQVLGDIKETPGTGGASASSGTSSTGGASASSTNASSSSHMGGADAGDAGPTKCVIGGMTHASGQVNPADACQICEPATDDSGWSNVADGTSCATGEICHMGKCIAGCEVGGTFYASAAAEPNNACQTCQPATSTTAFTSLADGASCGNGQVCASGQCGTQCSIGGDVYPTGTANPANACQSCQPGMSTSAWTTDADGTNCGSSHVCTTGNCVLGCYVSGAFYANAAANPANACQSCQPTNATTTWTDDADGTPCGTGQVCKSGACEAGCFIGGVVYASGAQNTSAICQTCQPGTSTTGWSNVPEGMGCGTGMVCNAGACDAGCYISGAFYAPSTVDTANACLECTPATSTSAWSDVANLTSCGSGSSVCCGGKCAACSLPMSSKAACSGTTCTDTCDAGYTTVCPGSPCTNLASDSSNCGACGHSCQGGACASSVCQPVAVVPNAYLGQSPTDFDTNGNILVWVDATAVWEMPSLGATPIELAPPSQANTPLYVGLDGAGQYATWIQNPVSAASQSGYAVLGMASSGVLNHSFGTGVYVTGMAYSGGAGSYQTLVTNSSSISVVTCNSIAPNCTTENSISTSNEVSQGLAYANDYVIFGDVKNNNVQALYLGTLTFTTIPSQTFLNFFAADGTYIYWFETQSSNVINRAAYGSTSVTQIATNAYGSSRFASDGTHIYFTNTNYDLVAMSNSGGTQTVLAAGSYAKYMKYVNGAVYFFGSVASKSAIYRVVYP